MAKRMMKISEETVKMVVNRLSKKYGFDETEALKYVGEDGEKKTNKKELKPLYPFPWTGETRIEWCCGIRVTKGLYGQCTNTRIKGEYCATCQKIVENPSKTLCTTLNRTKWLADNGKKPMRYANYMVKHGLSREEVEREAARFGMTIPIEEYELEENSRGRPRKTAAVSDTDSSSESVDKEIYPDLYTTLLAEVSAETFGDEGEAAKLAEKEEQAAVKLAEKEERAAMKAAKLAEKEERAAMKAAKLAEKEKQAAKKVALKEERAAMKLAEKEERVAMKAAKLAEKEEQAAMKAAKLAEKEEQAAMKAAKLAEKEERAAMKLAEKEEQAAMKAAKLAEKEDDECEMFAANKKKASLETLKETQNGEKERYTEEREAEREARRLRKTKKVNTEIDVIHVSVSAESVDTEMGNCDRMNKLFGSDNDDATAVKEADYAEEVSATPWTHGGIKYLKDSDNNLYDPETTEHIGMWDSGAEEIVDVESDSDSE